MPPCIFLSGASPSGGSCARQTGPGASGRYWCPDSAARQQGGGRVRRGRREAGPLGLAPRWRRRRPPWPPVMRAVKQTLATVAVLTDAVRAAAAGVPVTVESDAVGERELGWGEQLDVREITAFGADAEFTDQAVAAD